MSKNINHRNPEIAICEIAIESQPLDQDVIWTVDLTPFRSFADRNFEVTRTLNIKNTEILKCEIAK
jgi:hypothetical protein